MSFANLCSLVLVDPIISHLKRARRCWATWSTQDVRFEPAFLFVFSGYLLVEVATGCPCSLCKQKQDATTHLHINKLPAISVSTAPGYDSGWVGAPVVSHVNGTPVPSLGFWHRTWQGRRRKGCFDVFWRCETWPISWSWFGSQWFRGHFRYIPGIYLGT